MRQIDYAELDLILSRAIADYVGRRPIIAMLMQLQYNTGLRAGEVLETSRWSFDKYIGFTVQLQKSSNTRIINELDVPAGLIDYYKNQLSYFPINYNSYTNAVRRNLPVVFIDSDNKNQISHLFRYRFIKSLKEAKVKDTVIQSTVGHQFISTTNKYIYGDIWLA